MDDLKEFKEKMDGFFRETLDKLDSGSLQKLGAVFSTYEGRFREDVQNLTREQLGPIINKLTNDEQLTDGECAVIELWIVGDAQYSVKLENKFKAGLDELKQVQAEIDALCEHEPDAETISRLRAILEQGTRLIYPLALFLENKERIDNFKKAMSHLGLDERNYLIDILRSKSKSKEL